MVFTELSCIFEVEAAHDSKGQISCSRTYKRLERALEKLRTAELGSFPVRLVTTRYAVEETPIPYFGYNATTARYASAEALPNRVLRYFGYGLIVEGIFNLVQERGLTYVATEHVQFHVCGTRWSDEAARKSTLVGFDQSGADARIMTGNPDAPVMPAEAQARMYEDLSIQASILSERRAERIMEERLYGYELPVD